MCIYLPLSYIWDLFKTVKKILREPTYILHFRRSSHTSNYTEHGKTIKILLICQNIIDITWTNCKNNLKRNKYIYVLHIYYKHLATGQWFSTGTPVSSTNKTDRHDTSEILLKVALNTIKQTNKQTNNHRLFNCLYYKYT